MNLKANELRMGNAIMSKAGIVTVSSMIDASDGYYIGMSEYLCSSNIIEFTGIPLTEEWLLRLGFRKLEPVNGDTYRILTQYSLNNGDFVVERVYLGFNIYHVAGMFCNLKKNSATTHSIIPHGNLKSVHQLQNLYFALTGLELTLTDKS